MDAGARNTEIIAAEQLALIPVEANLEIPPLFQMRRTDPTNRIAECKIPVATTVGERLEQYWRISVPEPYELPGTFDQDAWVAVQTLINMRGGMPTDGKLYFSMYGLLEIMGRPDNGQNYKELRESLERLSATYIYSKNAFYSKDIEKFETRGFNLWDVHFSQTVNKKLGRASEKHELEFHSVVRRSFQAEYVKSLDKDFYYSLSSRFAKRLYRLIDCKRRDNLSWSVPLERLKQLLPLPASYRYPSKIKTVLKTAHGELQEGGFLVETSYQKAKNPIVRYRISDEFVSRRSLPTVSDTSSDAFPFSASEEVAYRRLREEHVWPNVARQLIRQKGAARCLKYVAALSYQRGIQDTGAWLRWAIETDFELDEAVLDAIREVGQAEIRPTERDLQEVEQSSVFTFTPPASHGSDPDAPGDNDDSEMSQPSPDPQAGKAWSSLVTDLIQLRGKESLPPWFGDFKGGQLMGSTLTVLVPNSTAANHLNEHFGADLVCLWRERAGADAVVQVATDLGSEKRAALSG